MAKDDYFVVVFKLLNYFYQKMKAGESINQNDLTPAKLGINLPYLMDIYRNLFEDGYLTGSYVESDYDGLEEIHDLSVVRITTKGVEYLQDNSKMKQVYKTLKELKEWIPGM